MMAEIPPVGWPSNDAEAPDYAHVDTLPPGGTFPLTPGDLDLLVRANHFDPQYHEGKIVFALRGATLASGHQAEGVSEVVVKDVRPNHLSFRCIIGLYDRPAGRLWAYTASTVPNALSMKEYYQWRKELGPESRTNLLPCGCYVYRRSYHGWSRSKKKPKVPVALRLTQPGTPNRDAVAIILRNPNDLVYRSGDSWEKAIPKDNICPAFSSEIPDTAGCLAIRGSNVPFTDEASEQWKQFQGHIAGMPKNTRIDLLLLTGAEARIANSLREAGRSGDEAAVRTALERLRTGSTGRRVEMLQEFLGVGADGNFGPNTKLALIEKQKAAAPLDRVDGIYSPQMDELFDQSILLQEPG